MNLFTRVEDLAIRIAGAERHGADLVVCCEVLEHLKLARGKYIGSLGNTPGHLQHWSARAFTQLVARYFELVAVRTPLPWTIALCRRRA